MRSGKLAWTQALKPAPPCGRIAGIMMAFQLADGLVRGFRFVVRENVRRMA